MSELGVAYVSVSLSTKGQGKQLIDELGDVGDRGGKEAGKKGSSSLGKWLKRGVATAGLAAGGLLATSLVKGWGRLTKIENATAKLSGLGHSAKSVQTIMDDALASVKGTAYGLDEAAAVAAATVAAGVKPGKDLERTLKLVGDAATIGGTSMAEMGAVFGKVASSGKITGRELNQLNMAGIPIVQLLGESMGKTSEQITQMVSQGKVSFSDFRDAIEEGMGGAALKSGETTEGALANMWAAFGRFGAILAGPVFSGTQKFFVGITGWVDQLAAKTDRAITFVSGKFGELQEFFEAGSGSSWDLFRSGFTMDESMREEFADSLADDKLMRFGADLRASLDRGVAAVRGSVPKMKAASRDFWSGLMGEGGDSVGARIGETLRNAGLNAREMIGPAFTATVERLQSIWEKLADTGRRVLKPLSEIFGTLAVAFGDAFKAVSGSGLSVWGALLKLADKLAGLLQKYLVPALSAVAKWLKENRVVVAAVFTGLIAYKAAMLAITVATKAWAAITGVATAAQKLLNGAMKANPIGLVIAGVTALVAAFAYLWNNSEGFRNFWISVWEAIKSVALTVVNWFKTYVVGTFVGVWKAIEKPVLFFWDVISSVFKSVKKILSGFIDFFKGVFTGNWKQAWEGIKKIFSGIWDAMVGQVKVIIDWFGGLPGAIWDKIKAFSGWLLQKGKDLINWIKNGIVDGAKAIWTWFTNLPTYIWNAIKGLGETIKGYGKKIIGWIRGGILSGALAIRDWFRNIGEWLWGHVKSALASIRDIGKAIINAVVDGIKSTGSAIWNAITSLFSGSNARSLTIPVTLSGKVGSIQGVGGGHIGGGVFGGRKASGGPVDFGKYYLVGEKGPELWAPGPTGGQIIPNHEIGSRETNINVSMHGHSDPWEIAAEVDRRLAFAGVG